MKQGEYISGKESVRSDSLTTKIKESLVPKMTLTFLGTGTSNGVPVIGCNCKVCKSKDPRDNRLRTSALLETEHTRVLIDCDLISGSRFSLYHSVR